MNEVGGEREARMEVSLFPLPCLPSLTIFSERCKKMYTQRVCLRVCVCVHARVHAHTQAG